MSVLFPCWRCGGRLLLKRQNTPKPLALHPSTSCFHPQSRPCAQSVNSTCFQNNSGLSRCSLCRLQWLFNLVRCLPLTLLYIKCVHGALAYSNHTEVWSFFSYPMYLSFLWQVHVCYSQCLDFKSWFDWLVAPLVLGKLNLSTLQCKQFSLTMLFNMNRNLKALKIFV